MPPGQDEAKEPSPKKPKLEPGDAAPASEHHNDGAGNGQAGGAQQGHAGGQHALVPSSTEQAADNGSSDPGAPTIYTSVLSGPYMLREMFLQKQEQEGELVKLATDAEYRQQQLGSSKLRWAAIGQRLGHTQSSARHAFIRLRRAAAEPSTGAH